MKPTQPRISLISILPKILIPLWTELRIAHRVRDIPMPKILLDGARVLAVVRKLVAGRVTQHMRMDGEGEFRELAGELAHLGVLAQEASSDCLAEFLPRPII